MKCSKLINILQELEYELDDPDVVLNVVGQYDSAIEIRVAEDSIGQLVIIE